MKKKFYIEGVLFDIEETPQIENGDGLTYYTIFTEIKNGTCYAIQYIIEKGRCIDDTMAKYVQVNRYDWECLEWHDLEYYATQKEAEALHNHIKEKGLFFGV